MIMERMRPRKAKITVKSGKAKFTVTINVK